MKTDTDNLTGIKPVKMTQEFKAQLLAAMMQASEEDDLYEEEVADDAKNVPAPVAQQTEIHPTSRTDANDPDSNSIELKLLNEEFRTEEDMLMHLSPAPLGVGLHSRMLRSMVTGQKIAPKRGGWLYSRLMAPIAACLTLCSFGSLFFMTAVASDGSDKKPRVVRVTNEYCTPNEKIVWLTDNDTQYPAMKSEVERSSIIRCQPFDDMRVKVEEVQNTKVNTRPDPDYTWL